GGMDGVEDRVAGRVDIDDDAVLHAARHLVADADDVRLVADAPRDEAAHLAGADVDDADSAARADGELLHVAFPWRPFLPFGFGGSVAVRTTSRSGRRRSTSWISRSRMRSLRSICARRRQPAAGSSSGSA